MTDIARSLRLGCRIAGTGSAPAFQSHSVDANNDGVAFVCRARDTNPITHLGARYGARTGTPPSQILALEGRNATTGNPDGTPLGGGTPASVIVTPPADATWDGTFRWFQLANPYTPTIGELLVFTIRYSSGTVDASNFSSWTSHVTNVSAGAGFARPWRLTAGSWAGAGNFAVFGIRTASTRYGNIMQSIYTTRSAATVGHRVAMKAKIPSGPFASYTLGRLQFTGSIGNAGAKNPLMALWDATSALQSTTLDTEDFSGVTTATTLNEVEFDTALSALTPGTDYRMGLEVGTAINSGVILQGIQLADAADRDAWEGGTNVCLSTYDGATWTDDTTVIPMVQATLYDVTASGGSGGGPVVGGRLVRA